MEAKRMWGKRDVCTDLKAAAYSKSDQKMMTSPVHCENRVTDVILASIKNSFLPLPVLLNG